MKRSLSDVCDDADESIPEKVVTSSSDGDEGVSKRSKSTALSPSQQTTGENAQTDPGNRDQMSDTDVQVQGAADDTTALSHENETSSTDVGSRRRRRTARPDQTLDFMCQGKEEKQLYAALRASLSQTSGVPDPNQQPTTDPSNAEHATKRSRLRARPPPKVPQKPMPLPAKAQSKTNPKSPKAKSKSKAKSKPAAAFEHAVREAVSTNTNKAGGTQLFRELVGKARRVHSLKQTYFLVGSCFAIFISMTCLLLRMMTRVTLYVSAFYFLPCHHYIYVYLYKHV